ncbi:Outer membrane protein TolC [Stigmatella aurantiaca]|uniref:Outer membrane protein TolC n=1 Tax=Stigmatella aurantiaca TaxID=41 RepID=A0A1H7ZR36_STIAU|nr:TolC family protein [Stigmatella aurantiaca]SEM61112.1 Outer membrane protein TolC [Stigmatella aurantiaca]
MGTKRSAAGLVVLLGWTGCVSPSMQSDLTRVRELTRVPLPSQLALPRDEAQGLPEDVRALLQQPLTAEAAVRIALLNNRELRASLRELGVARGQLVQAGVLPNPSVEVELHQQEDAGQPFSPQTEIRVEYGLSRALLSVVRSKVARSELEAARYRTAGTVVELGYTVRAAHYALQAAQQRMAIATQALDAFAAARDASRALFEAGNIPELDTATQEAAYESARANVAQLELETLERREQLQRLLGLHGEATAWTVTDTLPRLAEQAPTFEDLERKALTASLELAETQRRLEGTAQRSGLTRAEGWIPDVTVGVIAEREGHGTPSHGEWAWGGAIHFTVPLFDRQQGTRAASEAEFDALMERYQGMAIDIRSAAREARNRVESTYLRARQYQQVLLPARQRVMRQTLLQYNAMQIGIFQVLQARREQLDAELAYVGLLQEHWTAQAALDALLAGRRAGAPQGAGTAPSLAGGAEAGGH